VRVRMRQQGRHTRQPGRLAALLRRRHRLLTPYLGNRGFPCRSHYWIKAGQIRWSHAWTDDQIAAGRARDDRGRVQYFAARVAAAAMELPSQQHQADARTLGFRPQLPSWVTTLLSHLRPGKRHGQD
jgi:hypothetical protein